MIAVTKKDEKAVFTIPLGKTDLKKKRDEIRRLLRDSPEFEGSLGFALILEGLETLILAGSFKAEPVLQFKVPIRGDRP